MFTHTHLLFLMSVIKGHNSYFDYDFREMMMHMHMTHLHDNMQLYKFSFQSNTIQENWRHNETIIQFVYPICRG